MLNHTNQIAACVGAWRTVWPLTSPVDASLGRFFRHNPNLGSKDRKLVAETIFCILRRYALLESLLGDDDNAEHWILAAWQRCLGITTKQISPLLDIDQLAWWQTLKAKNAGNNAMIDTELPDWLRERLEAQWPEDNRQLAYSLQEAAPLDIRVNTLKITRDALRLSLAKAGIESTPTPFSPYGLRLEQKHTINRLAQFLNGEFEVQDEGSQLLGMMLSPRRQDMIVDFCAGAGGKTLLLGMMMRSQGRLYAFDISEKRLNNLKPRLKRSGLSNIQSVLLTHENDERVKRLAGKIDRVLVDAPCSGFGTLRRNPDLKWRQDERCVAELNQKQTAILNSASRLLKIGGRLVYATCSLIDDENQGIVNAFLASHPNFRRLPANDILAAHGIDLVMPTEDLQLLPHLHHTDGFYAAALERIA